MRYLWLIALSLGTLAIAAVTWYMHSCNRARAFTRLILQTPHQGPIREAAHASGVIEIPELLKIGSLQPGIVQEILVKENQVVHKGQLLATMHTTKGTTDLQVAYHRLKRAMAERAYLEKTRQRNAALHKAGQISDDAFEQIEKEYKKADHEVHIEAASAKRAKIDYETTRIKAPADGIITAIYATQGMVASDVSNTTLFEIAPNITTMHAIFDIDESMIASVHPGTTVAITITAFPDLVITTSIQTVSFVPRGNPGEPIWYFKAQAALDNKAQQLRPGMVIHGTLTMREEQQALLIPDSALRLSCQQMHEIAQACNIQVCQEPTTKEEQQAVWVLRAQGLHRINIKTGLYDGSRWQITDGLSQEDQVVVGIQPPPKTKSFSFKL